MKKYFAILILVLMNLSIGSLTLSGITDPEEIRKLLPKLMGASNIGTDYWITIPPPYYHSDISSNNYIRIFVSSFFESTVTVEVPERVYVTKYASAHQITEFILTPADAQPYIKSGMTAEVIEYVAYREGIHIFSDTPLLVYVLIDYQSTSDGFLAIPVSALGNEYIVSSYPDGSNNYPLYASLPSLTGIVAVFDDTEVKFTVGGNTLTQTAGKKKPGDILSAKLNRGDVWIFSSGGKEADLSGSKIVSDKPVAVVSANQCANIPTYNGMCNYIVNMEFPTHTWGRYYHAPSVAGRKFSPIIRIYAKEPDTRVFRDSSLLVQLSQSGGIIGKGYFETRVTSDELPGTSLIWADKPICVQLYNTGYEEDGDPKPNSEPFQMPLIPEEQYQDEITFYTPGYRDRLGFFENNICIICELDGNGFAPEALQYAKINPGPLNWSKIRYDIAASKPIVFSTDVNGKKYGAILLNLQDEGIYKIKASTPMTAYCYGFSASGSYGYAAAAGLINLETLDKEPPFPEWKMKCDGNVEGIITDKPDNPGIRSNLASATFFRNSSNNYEFDIGQIIPGKTYRTNWNLKIINPQEEATAVIFFADQAGNDTTIRIQYFPLKIEILPAYQHFGLVKLGESIDKKFTIRNNSTEGKAVLTEIKLKKNDQDFTISSRPVLPLILDEQKDTTITVTFTAKNDGVFSDEIGAGDSCLIYYTSRVEAEVGPPEIIVTDIPFGDITKDLISEGRGYIRNEGKSDLVITGYVGPNNPDFKLNLLNGDVISPDTPLIIKPKIYPPYEFRVTFKPSELKNYEDSIVFITNAPKSDSVCLLTGIGRKAGLVANSIDFGRKRIKKGPYYHPEGIILRNTGNVEVKVTGFQVVDSTKGSACKIDPTLLSNVVIPPDSFYTIPIEFNPLEPGYHELLIKFINDAESNTQCRITGIGIVPRIYIDSVVDFGTTLINDDNSFSDIQVRITNLSFEDWLFGDSLMITGFIESPQGSISSDYSQYGSGGFKYDNSQLNLPRILQPGESIILNSSFSARREGLAIAYLETISDAEYNLKSAWRGMGITQGVRINNAESKICMGSHDTIYFTFENYGNITVKIDSVWIEPYENSLTFLEPSIVYGFTIEPQKSVVVGILFNPGSPMKRTAKIHAANSVGINIFGNINYEAYQIERILYVKPPSQAAYPGNIVTCSVNLENGTDISFLNIKSADFRISYNNLILDFILDSLRPSAAAAGFIIDNPVFDYLNSYISFRLKSIEGSIINKAGSLIQFAFRTYFPPDSNAISDVKFDMGVNNTQCVKFINKFGKISIKPVCINEQRIQYISNTGYQLQSIYPNPASGDVFEINFSVGLKGYTELHIYNSTGSLLSKPVSKELDTGNHTVEVPLSDMPSGIYICRLISGIYSDTKHFAVMK